MENPYRKYGPLGEDRRNNGAVRVTMKLTIQLARSSTAHTLALSLVGMISEAYILPTLVQTSLARQPVDVVQTVLTTAQDQEKLAINV